MHSLLQTEQHSPLRQRRKLSSMSVTSIDEAKELLYGLPVESFVIERNELVKAVRADGDRELANEVKALRKPSAVAAEVNRIVRADPGGVELILQAAELLRSAQTGALGDSGISASDLQSQYRAAIKALAQTAENKRVEVRAALEAATIDVASNDDLRAGSLVIVPTPVALFGGDPSPVPAKKSAPKSAEQAASAKNTVEDELAKRRALKATKKSEQADEAAAHEEAAAEKTREAEEARLFKEHAREEARLRKEREREEARQQKEREREEARLRKEREKQRKARRKALAKEHREALRTHLAALDAEDVATSALETAELEVGVVDRELAALEKTMAELTARREHALGAGAEAERSVDQARETAASAEAAVEALAAEIEALDEQIDD